MSRLCKARACFKPARYRVWYDGMIGESDVQPCDGTKRTCVWCLDHALEEAAKRTATREARDEARRLMDVAGRTAWRSDVPLPRDWQMYIDRLLTGGGRFGPRATRGGDIDHGWRERYLFLEVIPPRIRPEGWSAEGVLYALRYRCRLPLVFVSVPLADSPISGQDTYARLPIVAPQE